jgi:hypothetical protein
MSVCGSQPNVDYGSSRLLTGTHAGGSSEIISCNRFSEEHVNLKLTP